MDRFELCEVEKGNQNHMNEEVSNTDIPCEVTTLTLTEQFYLSYFFCFFSKYPKANIKFLDWKESTVVSEKTLKFGKIKIQVFYMR